MSPDYQWREALVDAYDAAVYFQNNAEEYGISVDDMVAVGMPHGFYEYGFGKIGEGEMDFLGDDVKEMIRNGKFAQASQECLGFIKKHF